MSPSSRSNSKGIDLNDAVIENDNESMQHSTDFEKVEDELTESTKPKFVAFDEDIIEHNNLTKVASGAYEAAPSDSSDVNTNVQRRRSSIAPSFEPGSFGLLSSIPPPIPESLPTTPGFELSELVFNNRKDPLKFPDQQTHLSRDQSTTNFATAYPLAEEPIKDEEPQRGMTLTNPPRNRWRIIAVCLWATATGMSDGAPGAILDDIEEYYGITYSIVSLIWLSNALGFILVAFISNKLDQMLGKRKMIAGGTAVTVIMYSLLGSGTKFPAICVGFFFGGIGLASGLTQMNIFLSRFEKASTYLGWYHGCYGAGATVAPIMAASMVNAGIKWHYYYLILLGAVICNLTNLWFAFAGADEDLRPWDHQEVIHDSSEAATPEDEIALNDLHTRLENSNIDYRHLDESGSVSRPREIPQEPVIPHGDFKLAIKNARTWFLTAFVFCYQGAEVSMPGWLETFLVDYRHGDADKLGYVASGFWAGLTIGRLFLVERLHKHFGAKRGVSVLALSAIFFVALAWPITNIVVEAVLVSIAGICVGPIYPLMITVATRVLPRKIQVISLTIMTSGGSSGGALWPFLTGLISQFSGAFVVMPMFIALFSSMVACWFILPNPDRPTVKSPWQRLF